MSSIPSWLWLTAGWCAVAAGAWLLFTGRRKWRRRTGRCCRRCGYDMSGVPGMTCPECGREALSEREMLRLPARKRWRLAGVALLCLGWVVWQVPAVIAHGWAGGVPGWVLVRWAPIKTDATDATTVRDLLDPMFSAAMSGGTLPSPGIRGVLGRAKPPPPPMGMARLRSDLYLETWRRVHQAELSDAESARYLRRLFDITPESLIKHANLPPAWPSDRRLPEPDSFSDTTGTYLIPSAPCVVAQSRPGFVTITSQVMLGNRTIEIARAEAPLDTTVPAARFMRPIDTAAAGDELVRALQPTVSLGRGQVRVEFTGRTALKPTDAPYALALKVRVFSEGRVIATGTCGYEGLSALGHSPVFAHTQWEDGGVAVALAQPETLEIELTGVPRQTLLAYLVRDTSLRDAWSGTVRVKPRIIRDAE